VLKKPRSMIKPLERALRMLGGGGATVGSGLLLEQLMAGGAPAI
jgi:hypothetical protein